MPEAPAVVPYDERLPGGHRTIRPMFRTLCDDIATVAIGSINGRLKNGSLDGTIALDELRNNVRWGQLSEEMLMSRDEHLRYIHLDNAIRSYLNTDTMFQVHGAGPFQVMEDPDLSELRNYLKPSQMQGGVEHILAALVKASSAGSSKEKVARVIKRLGFVDPLQLREIYTVSRIAALYIMDRE